jgi:hypothetical protein
MSVKPITYGSVLDSYKQLYFRQPDRIAPGKGALDLQQSQGHPATEKSWDVAAALHLYPVTPIVFGLHSSRTVSRYPNGVASTKT